MVVKSFTPAAKALPLMTTVARAAAIVSPCIRIFMMKHSSLTRPGIFPGPSVVVYFMLLSPDDAIP